MESDNEAPIVIWYTQFAPLCSIFAVGNNTKKAVGKIRGGMWAIRSAIHLFSPLSVNTARELSFACNLFVSQQHIFSRVVLVIICVMCVVLLMHWLIVLLWFLLCFGSWNWVVICVFNRYHHYWVCSVLSSFASSVFGFGIVLQRWVMTNDSRYLRWYWILRTSRRRSLRLVGSRAIVSIIVSFQRSYTATSIYRSVPYHGTLHCNFRCAVACSPCILFQRRLTRLRLYDAKDEWMILQAVHVPTSLFRTLLLVIRALKLLLSSLFVCSSWLF